MESPEINPYICDCFSGKFIGNEICVSVCARYVCRWVLSALLCLIRSGVHVHDEKDFYYRNFLQEYLLLTMY